jgi:hypothetical protein
MSAQLVPLTNQNNQQLTVSLEVDGQAIDLALSIWYNAVAGYWNMDISTPQGVPVLNSIPLVCGDNDSGNLLAQYGYLGIGSMTIVNASQVPLDYPNSSDLGTDFLCIWVDVAAA